MEVIQEILAQFLSEMSSQRLQNLPYFKDSNAQFSSWQVFLIVQVYSQDIQRLPVLLHLSVALKASLEELFALPFPFTLILPWAFNLTPAN